MTDTFRALCAELLKALESWSPGGGGPLEDADEIAEADLMARARTLLAQPEPQGAKPVVDYSRVPEIATKAQIRSAAQYLVKKRNCDGDLIPAIEYAIARWGRPAPQPEPEVHDIAGEVASVLLSYATVDPQMGISRILHERHFGVAGRAIAARWGRPTPQPPADGEVGELVEWLGEEAVDYEMIGEDDQAKRCDRTAELLQRQHPQPVAVSERLPGPEDCGPWPDEPDAVHWCWFGSDADGAWSWEQRSAGEHTYPHRLYTHWLPFHALPVPTSEGGADAG